MYSAGLVLEGGGLRCAYESGVLDAFMENGITFPYVIGVSAGSCNGILWLIMLTIKDIWALNLYLKTVNF